MQASKHLSHLLFVLALIASTSALAQPQLFATTTTYEITGNTSRMSLSSPWSTTLNEYTIHSDAVVRKHGCYIYILNRLYSDNVLVLDACNNYSVITQYSLSSTGLNPHDIELTSPNVAWITLYDSTKLLKLNPLTGTVLGTVDLSIFADNDGLPEADQLQAVGDLLFISMQKVNRSAGWTPVGSSALAVYNTATGNFVDADPSTPEIDPILLSSQNPFWRMSWLPQLGRLLVLCSGNFLVSDGAIEIVNPFTLKNEGSLISEAQLGGDLLDFHWVNSSLAWALRSDATFKTCLVKFNPTTGELLEETFCTSGFDLSDMEASIDGHLFLSDRSSANPGVRILDLFNGTAVAGPISLGLPAFDMVLIEGLATSSPTLDNRRALLKAFPNPFNPSTQIFLYGAENGAAVPLLKIHDAQGRRIDEISGQRDGARIRYVWKAAGHASAVYYGSTKGAESIPLLLLK